MDSSVKCTIFERTLNFNTMRIEAWTLEVKYEDGTTEKLRGLPTHLIRSINAHLDDIEEAEQSEIWQD